MQMTQRGQLDQHDEARLALVMRNVREAEAALRMLTAEMVEKSSYREVSRLTGLSTNTLQRWKREAGK